MREILFRGKKVTDGEWVYGYYVQTNDFLDEIKHNLIFEVDSVDYYCSEFAGVHEVDPQTVDQYTGLTDKNGAKIFEKDIVEADFGIAGMNKLVVEFETGAFYLCHNARLMYLLRNWHDYVEVVGNLYDNPELLGGDENERD